MASAEPGFYLLAAMLLAKCRVCSHHLDNAFAAGVCGVATLADRTNENRHVVTASGAAMLRTSPALIAASSRALLSCAAAVAASYSASTAVLVARRSAALASWKLRMAVSTSAARCQYSLASAAL